MVRLGAEENLWNDGRLRRRSQRGLVRGPYGLLALGAVRRSQLKVVLATVWLTGILKKGLIQGLVASGTKETLAVILDFLRLRDKEGVENGLTTAGALDCRHLEARLTVKLASRVLERL